MSLISQTQSQIQFCYYCDHYPIKQVLPVWSGETGVSALCLLTRGVHLQVEPGPIMRLFFHKSALFLHPFRSRMEAAPQKERPILTRRWGCPLEEEHPGGRTLRCFSTSCFTFPPLGGRTGTTAEAITALPNIPVLPLEKSFGLFSALFNHSLCAGRLPECK